MKNKLLHALLLVLLAVPISTVFFSPVKTQAEGELNVDISGLERSDGSAGEGGAFQVMPGDTFQVKVTNSDTTRLMQVAIYVYLRSNASKWKPTDPKIADNFDIAAGSMVSKNVSIDNSYIAGDYTIRVYGYLLKEVMGGYVNDALVYDNTDLIIRTSGIVFNPADNPSSVKKGDLASFKIKFYSLRGKKFSIYIDNFDEIRRENVLVDQDPMIYSDFSWQTNDSTVVGPHKIIVRMDTGITKEFSIEVTDPSAPGGTPGTFNITDLNNYKIGKLLAKCSNDNLDGIVCLAETTTSWLLDIGAVISFIMILYASIVYLTSFGDESKAELAKKTLVWSFVGVIVISLAMTIMWLIRNTIENPSSTLK